MNDEFDTLIIAYLDETLTEEQFAELETWINTDPLHAKRFADTVFFEERLEAELKLKKLTEKVVTIPKKKRGGGIRNIAALVACLALIVGLGFYWQANQINNEFASVVQTMETKWATGDELSVGSRISSQTVYIESGIVRLAFDNGVEVTLQGPAEFELKSIDTTRLHSGILTCTVPPGAEGFRVDTRTAQVVDLGTTFGIEQRQNGLSKVSVFDGEVEIITDKTPEKQLLTEGKTMQLALDGSVNEVEFSYEPFEKLWPAASGIAGSTGDFRFAPPWPRPLRLIESDTEIIVLPEGYAKILEHPCPVDVIESELVDAHVPAGRRVRSYLLQFNPTDEDPTNGSEKIKRIEGSITFGRPVIGLIINSETLQKTDELFSLRSGKVPQLKRGLELNPPRGADTVSLSEDGRTVTLKLGVFEKFSDHVRVIVDASLREF